MITKYKLLSFKQLSFIIFDALNLAMKKLSIVFLAVFLTATLFSCKSNHRCAAYSKAEVVSNQNPS